MWFWQAHLKAFVGVASLSSCMQISFYNNSHAVFSNITCALLAQYIQPHPTLIKYFVRQKILSFEGYIRMLLLRVIYASLPSTYYILTTFVLFVISPNMQARLGLSVLYRTSGATRYVLQQQIHRYGSHEHVRTISHGLWQARLNGFVGLAFLSSNIHIQF